MGWGRLLGVLRGYLAMQQDGGWRVLTQTRTRRLHAVEASGVGGMGGVGDFGREVWGLRPYRRCGGSALDGMDRSDTGEVENACMWWRKIGMNQHKDMNMR